MGMRDRPRLDVVISVFVIQILLDESIRVCNALVEFSAVRSAQVQHIKSVEQNAFHTGVSPVVFIHDRKRLIPDSEVIIESLRLSMDIPDRNP